MRLGIIGGACVLLTLALSGIARADEVDDQFIDTLAALGITGDRDQLIADGHSTCDTYGSPAASATLLQIMGRGLTNGQAGNVMLAGLQTYCPEKVPPR